MSRKPRAITLSVVPISDDEAVGRLARATAILLRIAERMDARCTPASIHPTDDKTNAPDIEGDATTQTKGDDPQNRVIA